MARYRKRDHWCQEEWNLKVVFTNRYPIPAILFTVCPPLGRRHRLLYQPDSSTVHSDNRQGNPTNSASVTPTIWAPPGGEAHPLSSHVGRTWLETKKQIKVVLATVFCVYASVCCRQKTKKEALSHVCSPVIKGRLQFTQANMVPRQNDILRLDRLRLHLENVLRGSSAFRRRMTCLKLSCNCLGLPSSTSPPTHISVKRSLSCRMASLAPFLSCSAMHLKLFPVHL
jgi:hypothetical protein